MASRFTTNQLTAELEYLKQHHSFGIIANNGFLKNRFVKMTNIVLIKKQLYYKYDENDIDMFSPNDILDNPEYNEHGYINFNLIIDVFYKTINTKWFDKLIICDKNTTYNEIDAVRLSDDPAIYYYKDYMNYTFNRCPTLLRMEIKCPVCRTINNINKSTTIIKGSTIECCVCIEQMATVVFNKCCHINTCLNCVDKLKYKKM